MYLIPPSGQSLIEQALGSPILKIEALSGGSINEARLIHTAQGPFFLKYNNQPEARAFFTAEVKGLELLRQTAVIRIPKVIGHFNETNDHYLILEYLSPGIKSNKFWEQLGNSLALLHRCTAPQFGLDHSNFIGSLPQSNTFQTTWPVFFWQERLLPQIKMAREQQLIGTTEIHAFERFRQRAGDLFPEEVPALTHGDLWSGNFLVDTQENPVLIDPAVSYTHREMDLAMSHLFGGFAPAFYRAYAEEFPLESGFDQRLSYYQLYYLMVHVNLFGTAYLGAVNRILKPF